MKMVESDEQRKAMAERTAGIEAMLRKDLHSVIERYRSEFYLTYAQMIGCFELVKCELVNEDFDSTGS